MQPTGRARGHTTSLSPLKTSSSADMSHARTVLRSSIPHYLRTGHASTPLVPALSPGFRIASRLLSNAPPKISQQSRSPSDLPYRASDTLKAIKWPEEDLASTADEGAGFYPVRLGETFDDGRFVVTRKLGWGGYSTVWLARDRKYALKKYRFPLDK